MLQFKFGVLKTLEFLYLFSVKEPFAFCMHFYYQ